MAADAGKHESSVGEDVRDAGDELTRGARKGADKAGEWRDRGAELASEARSRAGEAMDDVREFVRDKPIESAAIFLVAGWLLGRIVGGRR